MTNAPSPTPHTYSVSPKSVARRSNPKDVAGSKMPSTPSVEFSRKRKKLCPAFSPWPCSAALTISAGRLK